MRLNGGVLAALPLGALSQVITVTHTRSTCAAIYTTGTSYVTVIQSTVTMPPTASSSAPASGSGGPVSTVTVSPVPSASASALSDAALNAGTPFVISIAPATYGKKRQSITGTYLDANGYTTTNASQAVEYRIVNGTLQAVGGGWVSTYLGVLSAPFAVNATLGPINTLFFAGSLSIQWNNTSFDNGAAEFYTVATGDGRSQVVVRFNGPVQPNWAAVKFAAAPTVGTTTPPASSAVASMSVQTIISMGSMTIPYTPPVSSGPATSGPASSRPASSGPATIAITSTVSAAVSSGVVQIPSSTTANVQPQGSCGASRGGFNCYGAPDGNCCSEYGFCGSGPTYCGAGCQVGYGECDQVVVSSSALPSSSAAATGPGFSSGAPVYSSSAQSSIPIIPVSRSSSAAVSSAPASSIPVAITSSLPPVYSTTWSVTVSNGVSITNTVVYTSTPVSVSTSWSLPVYTTPGQPIGPDNPITWTSSASATVAPWSSSATASSSQAAPSYGQSSVFISSAPVASFAASSVWSSVASAASSVASAQSSWQSAAQSSSAAPAYSSAASVQSSIWSSVQSAAQSSVWSVAQSSSMPAPAYSSMQSAIASSVSSARSSAMSSAFSSVASVMSSSAAAVPHITTTTTTTTTSSSRTSTANAMTGTPSVCPTYNGQVYVDWTGGVFTIACGSDYNGDAQNGPVKNVASFEACLEWCDTLGTVCNAVVFDGGNGVGNCYIKPNPGSFVASSNANVNAAQRYVAPVVSSSLAASSSAAAMTSSMMSIPVYPSSAPVYPSSTVAQPAPSPSGCSTVDGTVVTDTMGGSYQISCNHDTDGDGVSVVGSPVAPNSWADCMNACDSVSTCLGFTYLGTAGTDGVGSGVCYLKGPNSPSFETASDSTLVSGIKTTGGSSPAPPASSSMAASSAAPSSIMEVPSSSAAAPSSSAAAPSSSVVVPPVYSPTLSSSMDVPPVTSSSPAYSSPAADVPSSTVPAAASSTSASCAADASAYLVLPCPTQCSFTNGDGTIPFPDADNDDSACEVDTPQPLQIYGQSFSKTYPSSNGIMGIGTLTSQYQPDTMPNADLNIPAIAVMWTDQIARGNYASPQEGAFYQFDDAGVTYEWYLTQGGNPGAHYHYTVRYNYANPGVYIYTYYDVGDGQNGNPGLVGMQGFAADGTTLEGFTYSLDTADIAPGLVLTCDTNANVCTKST